MSEEIEYVAHGELVSDKVFVDDDKAIDDLASKGYGDRDGKDYWLKNYEALYLLYGNKITINYKKHMLNFEQLVDIALKKDNDAWTRFLIYRDLRSRGYVAKEGFGFRVDFRVYERGDYGQKPAKYVVFGINEGMTLQVDKINDAIEQITRMGKEAVIAVIERRGEVIYYKVSKMRFINNKHSFDIASISKK